jgi:hypothetical protein
LANILHSTLSRQGTGSKQYKASIPMAEIRELVWSAIKDIDSARSGFKLIASTGMPIDIQFMPLW